MNYKEELLNYARNLELLSSNIKNFIEYYEDLSQSNTLLKIVMLQNQVEKNVRKYTEVKVRAENVGINSYPIKVICSVDGKAYLKSIVGRVFLPKQIFPEGVLVIFLKHENTIDLEFDSLIIPHECYVILKNK